MPARAVAMVVGQLQLGGAERQLFELATRLDRSRYTPSVICLSEVAEPYAGMLREAGIAVDVLSRAGHNDIGRARRLARLLRERRADLVHSFLIAANAYTYVSCKLWGRRRFVASSRTCIPPRGTWAMMVHRRAFHAAEAVIANSRRVMEFTRDLYRLDEGRIRVIPNGVALEGYRDDSGRRRKAARRSWGVADDELLVGTIGRLSPEKNLALFLDVALRRCGGGTNALPRERYVLVGDGPARAELEAQARRTGLGERVIFAGGRPDVASVLPGFDLFMTTSDTEGLPNAVMEAMAAGLPVIATRVGGTEEVVVDGATGCLVERGDAAGLHERLSRLASDPALRSSMGGRGRSRIETEFSVRRMVERTMAVYDEVLD